VCPSFAVDSLPIVVVIVATPLEWELARVEISASL